MTIFKVSFIERKPLFRSSLCKSSPSRNSNDIKITLFILPSSYTIIILGWSNEALNWASLLNRKTVSSSWIRFWWIILRATTLFKFLWIALYTFAIPPFPISSMISYLESKAWWIPVSSWRSFFWDMSTRELLQYLHLTALARINSSQYGHLFCSSILH